MRKEYRTYIFTVLLLFLLGCSLFQESTVASENNYSPQEIKASPDYELGERLVYGFAGYSFQPIKGYEIIPLDMQDGANLVILHDESQNFSFYVYGTKSDNRFESPEDVLVFWMPALTENDPNGEIKPVAGQPVNSIIINNTEGILINVSGQMLDKSLTGQVVSFIVSENQYLFLLGFSDAVNHSELWKTEGQKAFETLVSTVEFSK
jgi:hypothetical protein